MKGLSPPQLPQPLQQLGRAIQVKQRPQPVMLTTSLVVGNATPETPVCPAVEEAGDQGCAAFSSR